MRRRYEEALALRDAAALPVIEQIRKDQRQVGDPAGRMLAQLERALFESSLKVSALVTEHRAKHTSSFERLQTISGLVLSGYLLEARCEVAMRLLSTTELPLERVAELCGFAATSAFSRAFHRHYKLRPGRYRAIARAVQSRGLAMPDPALLRRRHLLQLIDEDADPAVIRAGLAAEARARGLAIPTGPKAPKPEQVEAAIAKVWWEELRELPEEAQRQAVRGCFHPKTPAMFHYLRRLSRVEGRGDRRRGVAIARSAMASLEPLGSVLPSAEHTRLEAHGWITLGNAQRLAGEHAEAEDAFSSAELLLAELPPCRALAAELACARCQLRCQQRRFGEALAFVNQAVAISAGDPDAVITALLCRGGVYQHLTEWERAAADYEAAARELATGGELYLQLVASQNLATSLVFWGRHEAAAAECERTKELADRLGEAGPKCHCWRLEGLLASQAGHAGAAEVCLVESRSGCQELGEWGNFAIVSLDLAVVLLGAGRAEEAVVVLSEALPHLEALRFEGEGLAAFRLLQRAVATQKVSMVVVEKVRASARPLLGTRPG